MVYLSNEQHVDVFFDDLHVTHARGRLMEEQNYYPHGLFINKTVAAGAIQAYIGYFHFSDFICPEN